jgi:hypothetical protein
MPENCEPNEDEAAEDHLGMTDEQWARFQDYTHGYGDQDENGVDLSLLRENLKLTPTQRLANLEVGAAFVKELQIAGAKAKISNRH